MTGLTLFLANAHRSAFAALLPPLMDRLSLTPSAGGALQAAMLTGYLAAQVPAGRWADAWGGPRVLLWSCAGWSAATALTALAVWRAAAAEAAAGPWPMAALVAARFLFGAASAGVMPCVAAMAVRWVPARERAASTSLVYAAFNLGGVAALAWAPGVAESAASGATGALLALGALGAAWAAAGGAWLQAMVRGLPLADAGDNRKGRRASKGGGGGGGGRALAGLLPRPADRDSAREVFTLCFTHGAMGCGFFLLSGLMPLILASIGGAAGGGAGAPSSLTALPWLAAAATGVLSGRAADAAIARGVPALRVRRAFQVASFALCALSALALAAPNAAERAAALFSGACPRALAAAALAANLVAYSLSFGGFHPYLQDVAGSANAGTLQGLTNSVSICGGAAATLLCGWAGEAHGGYGAAFAALAALYAAAAGVWAWGARGARVRLLEEEEEAG